MPYTLLPPPPASHTPDQILAEEQRWLRECAGDGEPRALLWQGPQCLIVTRKDTRLPRYQAACEQLAAEGWPVFVRNALDQAARTVEIELSYVDRTVFGVEVPTGSYVQGRQPGHYSVREEIVSPP